jgi:predicted tellurium resistance membrane protein TerC
MARKKNWKVVGLSLLGLICMILTFTVNWLFIILAAIFSWRGWRILMKEDKVDKKIKKG